MGGRLSSTGKKHGKCAERLGGRKIQSRNDTVLSSQVARDRVKLGEKSEVDRC